MIQRLEPARLDHAGHIVGGGYVHVVAFGAGSQLGKQLLVVREVALLQLTVTKLLEALDRLRRDIVVPVVDVQHVFLGQRWEASQQHDPQQPLHPSSSEAIDIERAPRTGRPGGPPQSAATWKPCGAKVYPS